MAENSMEYITPDKISENAALKKLDIYKMLEKITNDYAINSIYRTATRFYYLDNPNNPTRRVKGG